MIAKRILCATALALLVAASSAPAAAQTAADKLASRNATRERLRQLLAASGPKKGINLTFQQSTKNPYNFVSIKRDGLTNADAMEIVIGVSDNDTIGFRIFPHYKGEYVNVDKAKNGTGLMRKMLNLNDHNFLYWGADDSGDVFASYTFTLESGFPDKAMEVVLYSIQPLDQYVGEMRPFIDGSSAQ